MQTVTESSPLVVGGEPQAGRQRQGAADDPVAAHEAALEVEDVHRAAAPARGAVDAAEELGHHVLRVGAAGDRVAVGAVGADQVVVVAHHRGGADDRRLLADRQVKEAAGLGLLVLAPGLLLEAADQHHLREQLARSAFLPAASLARVAVGCGLRLGLALRLRGLLSATASAYPALAGVQSAQAAAATASSSRSSPQNSSSPTATVGMPSTPRSIASSVACCSALLDRPGLDPLQHRLRVQLAGRGGDQRRCRDRSGPGRRRSAGGRRRG